ncbi:alpha/beta-hydrolase family protein [Aliiruegeria lutimaris]|uniref:Alpha/beta-hydrolase family protein n=1 Tax=Aliiruegeria lutimaris TaxID=571298 RepID=A0A1G9JRP3_9RHOB|nr:alpha/beta-hydrolase family protein [Aliiruegeria lutimaris]SDL40218.1 Alpha/beta-hydrolase family protein [Aliiruegeria lutimaris]
MASEREVFGVPEPPEDGWGPHVPVMQGRLGGIVTILGDWRGMCGLQLRLFPQLPHPSERHRPRCRVITFLVAMGISAAFLWKAADWQKMGHRGRSFIARAPSAEEISQFAGENAMAPVRVYVGRRSERTARARAELALLELIRAGGFEHSAVVVVVPVGSGWMDPGWYDTLDIMLGSDVSTVAVQYSYLTSVRSLLAHPEYSVEQARELFEVIYDYWTQLPRDNRPKLYMHGMSQGVFNSQSTVPLRDVLGAPNNGTLWPGSRFLSPIWQHARNDRLPGSPAWMREERALDVSEEFRWFPVMTMFQLALDMAISLQVPRYGHFYVAPDYIDAWAEVVQPEGWSAKRAAGLKAIFERRPAPL